MVSAVICMSSRRCRHLCNLPCVYVLLRLVSTARYAFESFEKQNMKFAVNMLLTCILYCSPGPAAISTVCKHSR